MSKANRKNSYSTTMFYCFIIHNISKKPDLDAP